MPITNPPEGEISLPSCAVCGMPCRPTDYHPYSACLMFKACHNSETVRANLDAILARSAGAAEVTAPTLKSDTVIEFQALEDHLERWSRGECLASPKNGYDDPGHRSATIKDVTKTLAVLLPRFKDARAALLKFAVEYEQFKAGTFTPEDEGAGWPFPSSSCVIATPAPAAAPLGVSADAGDVAREVARVVWEEVGTYSVQCTKTGELAPSKSLVDAIDRLAQLATPTVAASSAAEPSGEAKFWLWKNGDHFLAFEHLYPCFTPGGDPMTLGEPAGFAIFKRSFDRAALPTTPKAGIHDFESQPSVEESLAQLVTDQQARVPKAAPEAATVDEQSKASRAIELAISVYEDVLNDIEGWEDKALSEAVESAKAGLLAILMTEFDIPRAGRLTNWSC